jgi:HAD superfamily hydrolase (TIGR01509 family)
VAQPAACLVDVYDTLLSYNFVPHRAEMPVLAGVTPEVWGRVYSQFGQALGLGQMTKADAFERTLAESGTAPRPELIRALVDRDRDLLLTWARLYDDALPFLQDLRSRGVRIVIVSNCSENTRALLRKRGVADLADDLVLSCEVGLEKPAPEIYRLTLDLAGVTAQQAVFVDDQPAFCAGAAALGITAVQIVRGEHNGKVPAPGTAVVRSLAEVQAMFWP